MARTMTGAAVGHVNRRFLFLALILAAISGILVYLATTRSGGDETSAAAGVTVVVAKQAIAAGTLITGDMLEEREVSSEAVGGGYNPTIAEVEGQVARFPIEMNEPVLDSRLVGGAGSLGGGLSYIIEDGKRGLAITVDQVTNAGFLVLPGDHVDILWMPGEQDQILADRDGAGLIAEDVEVLSVQQTLVDIAPTAPGLEAEGATGELGGGDRLRGSDAELQVDATTVTLLVTPQQASLIFCAQMKGSVRLAVRAFGDGAASGIPPVVCVLRAEEQQ
jgi:pilus assembly protein CpaB